MVTISLSDTSLAYLAAVALIGALVFLAKRNQKQGWRRQRISWVEAQSNAAARAFTVPDKQIMSDQPLQHLGDLNRLRESLTVHGEPQAPQKETIKSNVLA
jgi:hypothetical protein